MATLTAAEITMFQAMPEADLVDLAVELDLTVGEEVSVEALVGHAIDAVAALGKREGLPFTEYDVEDLAALPAPWLAALARLLAVSATPAAIVRGSARACRSYKHRTRSQIPLWLPMLLPMLARNLADGTTGV
jgi:hypothetical protein